MRADVVGHRTVSAQRVIVGSLLTGLVAAAPAPVSGGGLPGDAYLEVEGGSIIGGAHVVTGGGAWKITRNAGGLSLGPTNAHALRGPVSVNGVEYSGSSTQALILDDDAHGDYIEFDAAANHPIISFGGFLNIGAHTNYASLDAFYTDNTYGTPWIVAPQIMVDGANPDTAVQMEGTVGGRTVVGGRIPLTHGKTYWFSSKLDSTARTVYLGIYDPDNNYAVVGETTLTTDNPGAGWKLKLYVGRQDAHTGNTHQGTLSYMDNIIIDWTNHVYPLIPSAGAVVPPTPKPKPPVNLRTN